MVARADEQLGHRCQSVLDDATIAPLPVQSTARLQKEALAAIVLVVRILVNAAVVTGEPCGIMRYLQNLVPQLAGLCSVTVLTSCPSAFVRTGCQTVPIPLWTRDAYKRFLWEPTSLRRYCTRDCDVLFNPTPLGVPCARLPVISCVHDLTPLTVPRLHSPLYKATFWADLQSLRWADAVVVVSRQTARDLSRHRVVPDSRISIVPNGPAVRPCGESRSVGPGLQPYVLYVGGHWAHKNVRRLVDAFRRLKRPDGLRLVLVGGGPVRDIKDVLARLDLGNRVVLLQDLPDADLSSLYSHCSVFVCPSLYEGFGLPVLEAMAHGAPIACSNSSSLPEVARQAALYFDPRSVSDIAGQIQALLDNTALATRLRSAGPTQAARFSWERAAQDIHGIALQLVGQPDA